MAGQGGVDINPIQPVSCHEIRQYPKLYIFLNIASHLVIYLVTIGWSGHQVPSNSLLFFVN